jgi:FKBP-type peptidyl-prolyl cis-trans isomerase 2
MVSGIALCSGCSSLQNKGVVINPGDQVKVDYTCVAQGKGVVDTTLSAVADDENIPKSKAFFKLSEYQPLKVIAGPADRGASNGLKALDKEILNQIAPQVIGKTAGQAYDMVLAAETPQGIEDAIRYRVVDRIKKIKKVTTVSRKQYLFDQKKEPEVGKILYDNGVPSVKIIAADDKEVTFEKVLNKEGPTYWEVDFGVCRLDDLGDGFVQVTVDTQVGRLVRRGRVIGRVSKITDKNVVMDFGNPFAGYPLECKVQILDESGKDDQ